MLIMISCRQASELMSQQLDRKLSLGEKLRMHAHLLICKSCPRTLQQFEILREAGKHYAEHREATHEQELTLSDESRQRILSKLQDQQSDTKE